MQKKILLVEDEKDLSNGISIFLHQNSFKVKQSFSGKDALSDFKKFQPNIILLDTMLPDIYGDKLCKEFKEKSNAGIIFLTALSNKDNIINGFNCGADDYITKPFEMEILLARIHALLNRLNNSDNKSDNIKKMGSLFFDFIKNDISYNEYYADLTATEFKILYYLATHKQYCSVNQIFKYLYNVDKGKIESRTISVHITGIRKKLKNIGADCVMIKTKYKHGYMLSEKTRISFD